MRTKMWTQYTYRVRIDELGRGVAARGPRAEGGRGEESFMCYGKRASSAIDVESSTCSALGG